MRRGMPRGHANNRQAPRPQNSRQSGGPVPLMTGHLQGLKDIDMELELLKRKREIIEQQQEILSNNYRQRNNYEQPMFNESRDNRYDEYTRLYDDNSRSNSYGGGGSRKRPHVQVWENESAPKRFSGSSRGVKQSFGARLGPPPSNPRPAFQRSAERPAPKPYKPHPPSNPPKKNFNPTKVTKTYAPAAPKLASYKPAERKKLVTEALGKAGEADEWILRVDVPPSRQMTGRLELALGAIIKQLKHDHPQSEDLFNSPQAMRAMKQAVRDRVRTAMIGKAITTGDSIKAIYHEMFPKDTDEQVLMKGLESQSNNEFIFTNTDDPEVYFKKNMYRLLSIKLDEMISKIENIYTNQPPKKEGRRGYKKAPHRAIANETHTENHTEEQAIKPDDEHAEKFEKDKPDNTEGTDAAATDTSATDPPATDAPATDAPATDAEAIDAKETVTPADNTEPQADAVQLKSGENAPNLESTEKSHDIKVISEEKPNNTNVIEIVDTEDAQLAKLISTVQYKAFDRLMSYKIVHLLKKFSPAILKTMDVDTMYRRTKAAIHNETKNKLVGPTSPSSVNNTSVDGTSERIERRQPMHFVKILGKPSLPKRKAMNVFFSEYKPRTIKKHKTVHNLLFVGFTDKESFEKILEANGTVIGRFTLDIKVSERNIDPKNKPNLDDSNASEIIGPELDEQITDLLSTIRKAEEESFSEDVIMVEAPKIEKEGETKVETDEAAVEAEVKPAETDAIEINDGSQDDEEVVEIKDVPQEIISVDVTENGEQADAVPDLKKDEDVKGTPTRASARLAAPSGIRTRRMSKLE